MIESADEVQAAVRDRTRFAAESEVRDEFVFSINRRIGDLGAVLGR